MNTEPHITDVPFNDRERYKENILACIVYQVGEEANFLDEDRREAEFNWVDKYAGHLDHMIENDDIAHHVKFNIAHVRSVVEANYNPQYLEKERDEWVDSVAHSD